VRGGTAGGIGFAYNGGKLTVVDLIKEARVNSRP
jgi:hypothetical protein